MHISSFLHKTLGSVTHAKRLTTATMLVEAALKNKKISVTSLGRGISNQAQERSNIRRSDRLIGNRKFHRERIAIYGAMAKLLVSNQSRPKIIVDWSHVPNSTHYILRAALATPGGAYSLYEEVHPKTKEANPQVHQAFLTTLKSLLPDCCPIIITDAGFSCPWFMQVIALGWDYVGRIRGNKYFRIDGELKWHCYNQTFPTMPSFSQFLGFGQLTKTHGMQTTFYLVQKNKKGRTALNKYGTKAQYKNDKEYSESAKEPWLLVTSLQLTHQALKKAEALYSLRMKIEEGFRDLKSSQYGFSFEKAYSKTIDRIETLLVITMLASMVARLIGLVGESLQLHYQFQASSTKKRRVLSLFFLGCQIIRKKIDIPITLIFSALVKIQHISCSLIWEINL